MLAIALAQKVANCAVSAGERLLVRQEDDSDVLRSRTLTEARTVYNHHVLLAN